MSANERQVGGEHYKTEGEQHWDRMYRMFGPGYFVGCITKYVERYQRKNGYEDLQKAQHFLEKLIELEGMKPKAVPEPAPMSFEQMSSLLDDLTIKSSVQISNQRWKLRAGFSLNGLSRFECTVCGAYEYAPTEEEASAAHGACAQAHGYTQQG
jgi:hypothetical protein